MKSTEKDKRIQCHAISNTHWDREWRYSAQRTRYLLVYMIDMLFDIFQKEPRFKSFHLDSQTLPIQDYLEARPEMEDTVRRYVNEGKLVIGPWFCLPDEFCVSGESLVRNLLLGHKIARRFGKPAKTGYSPFSWGQISQMPQIYKGFGIDVMMFYRGVNTIIAPKSEFIWQGTDGTKIIASRMGIRPRYNIWYLLQRPVFWNETDIDDREISWKRGHAPFRFIDQENCDLDYQYVHPEFEYNKQHIKDFARQAIEEQNNDWTTPHRFWSIGHDSSCPDIREVQLINDCNNALGDDAEVFHSTVEQLQNGIRENVSSEWPTVQGEMRHSYTEGSASALWGWILSARTYLKQDNFRTERTIISYAEPMAVFAALLGASYPQNFIDLAYNYLLQNHGHDSIAGCGRDIVHEDVMYRFHQSREISSCVIERAMMDIVGTIDLSDMEKDEMALVVYNPAPFKRTEVNSAIIEIPQEWKCKGFEIVDEKGAPLPVQIVEEKSQSHTVVLSPNNVANMFPAKQFQIRVEYPEIPGLGYRTFRVKPVLKPKQLQPKTMLLGPLRMENEFLSVEINSNGTVSILNKATGKMYNNLGYFKDSSEIGNPWQHEVPPNETVFTTLNERPQISLIRDGALEVSFSVKFNWMLPEGRTHDERSRSSHFKPVEIINTYTLRKCQPWLEVVTDINNTVEDHYLQVSFPSNIQTDHVIAQGQFDVLKRPVAKPDYSLFREIPQTEHPMNSFVDLSDGQAGLALLNEGLKAYETHDDAGNTISLSLIRAFPLRICVTSEMLDYSQQDKGSQCLGRNTFKYAIMPHTGDWIEGGLWKASEQFNLMQHAAQVGPTAYGFQPKIRSFLELDPEEVHVSAIKRSEDGTGWIVRLFNPFNKTLAGKLRLNEGFSGPQKVPSPVERVQAAFALPREKGNRWTLVRGITLEEVTENDLVLDKNGWVSFEITPKKIYTIEFRP